MAAALAAVKPLSMTFLSAWGNASIAAAATSSASNAISIRPRYGARKGSSARSGRSELAPGLSDEARSLPLGISGDALTELEPAQVQLPPHAKVAGEAVERMPEGGGPVVLEQEVTQPREAVAAGHRTEQEPQVAGGDECQQAQHRSPGADVVERARYRVTVFAQVERVELRETAEARILWAADV